MPFSGSRCNLVRCFNGEGKEKRKGKKGINNREKGVKNEEANEIFSL